MRQNSYFKRNLPDWISPSLLDKFFLGFDRNLMPNKIWNVLNPWRFLKFWRDGSIRVRICNQISHRISDKIWVFLTYLETMTEFENFSSFFLNYLDYLYSQKYNSFCFKIYNSVPNRHKIGAKLTIFCVSYFFYR